MESPSTVGQPNLNFEKFAQFLIVPKICWQRKDAKEEARKDKEGEKKNTH